MGATRRTRRVGPGGVARRPCPRRSARACRAARSLLRLHADHDLRSRAAVAVSATATAAGAATPAGERPRRLRRRRSRVPAACSHVARRDRVRNGAHAAELSPSRTTTAAAIVGSRGGRRGRTARATRASGGRLRPARRLDGSSRGSCARRRAGGGSRSARACGRPTARGPCCCWCHDPAAATAAHRPRGRRLATASAQAPPRRAHDGRRAEHPPRRHAPVAALGDHQGLQARLAVARGPLSRLSPGCRRRRSKAPSAPPPASPT